MSARFQVVTFEECVHTTFIGVRQAVHEDGPGKYRLKCGCIVDATTSICLACGGSGDGPKGCCGDTCQACKGTGALALEG